MGRRSESEKVLRKDNFQIKTGSSQVKLKKHIKTVGNETVEDTYNDGAY